MEIWQLSFLLISNMNHTKRAIIIVNGRVQGVFFRQKTKIEADRLGLLGWVGNEDDGSVKIVVEGGEEKIKELIEWASAGPRLAKVKEVKVDWLKTKHQFSQFEVLM